MFKRPNVLIFRSKGKKLPDGITFLNVGGHDVALSENDQFLGLTMDEHLSWKNHLDVTKSAKIFFVCCMTI